MKDEVDSLMSNPRWQLVEIPKRKKNLQNKMGILDKEIT